MNAPSMETRSADVDVVIPLYNGGHYIAEAMLSVLGQTLPPRQLIVVDDGSTDQGAKVVREIIQRNSSITAIHYVRQNNAGPNAARNHGLRLGRSTYVAFLDADDIWLPRKLELQLARFQDPAFEDLALVYCGAYALNEHGERIPGPAGLEKEPLRGNAFGRLLARNIITGGASAILIKRSIFEKTGVFDEQLRTSEDYDMWLRISQAGSLDLVPEELVGLRYHGSNTSRNIMPMLEGMLQLTAKWFGHAGDRRDVLDYWGHLIALFTSRATDGKAAFDLVDKHLSKEQQRTLFRRAMGSLNFYVTLKRIRSMIDGHRSRA